VSAFHALTNVPIVINTSFNVRGEPPVCSPQDAIRCFLATDMDYLVLGDIMLNKAHMPQAQINQAKEVTFAKD
jgi:carbamoyltransferase